jgi:hypothetical protein
MAEENPNKKPKINFRSSKPRFNFRKNKPEQAPITNPDGTPVRDKDNAAPQHKPSFATRPAPNLAPPGMSGIKQPPQQAQASELPLKPLLPPEEQAGIALNENPDDKSLWTDGRIITMPGYTFDAMVFNEPSGYGIDEGKISKLQVRKDGHLVINYDRGWDIYPQTAEDQEALHRIRNGFDDRPEKQFKGIEKKPDKGHGFDL